MSLPTVLHRVAVDHFSGWDQAIPPQPPHRQRCKLRRANEGPPLPVEPAFSGIPAPAANCLRLRLHTWVYQLVMGFGSQALSRLPHLLEASPYLGGVRELPPHVGTPASGKFLLGDKRRFALPSGERMSVLTDAHGGHYVTSQSQARGGYGKLRVAMDFAGALYAVKELRLVTRAKPEATSDAPDQRRAHTKVSSPPMILEEIAMMAAASRSMHAHACFEVQGKVYLFLPLMADDATNLATGTPGFARAMVGRQVLLRTCEDLAAIHRRGYIHHDVKLHNILWNGAGEASLADFGLSCRVDEKTGTARASGRTAGNMPLEYELGAPFSWSLDTFMLGLAMADFYAPHMRTCPEAEQGIANMLALESWRTKVLGANGHVDLALLGEVPHLSGAEQTWDTYFAQVCAADAALGTFIIERMLNRRATARASLAEVQAFVEGLQPPNGAAARIAVRVMHTIAVNDWERQRLLRHMRHFKKRIQHGAIQDEAPGRWVRCWQRLKDSAARFGVSHEHPRQGVGAHQAGVDTLAHVACKHKRG